MFIGIYSCSNDSEWRELNDSQDETRGVGVQAVYSFPSVSDIVSSSVVQTAMENAWNLMKQNTTPSGRSEYGFYVYYNHANGTYYVGNTVAGTVTSGCAGTNASISLGPVTNNLQVCAFFHCHTALTYCPSNTSRQTGPSTSDINYANSQQLPGILYDYSASSIWGGHSKDDAYKYYTFGPNKRPDIYY